MLRGDLSGPILAIMVTIGILAAGLVLLAWFFWFAPQAGQAGTLVVVGTPAIMCYTQNGNQAASLYISFRNAGNIVMNVTRVAIEGKPINVSTTANGESAPVMLKPGETVSITINITDVAQYVCNKRSVEFVIITDQGTYQATAMVTR